MRRMDSGFRDRFPRLPPGCTPSDLPGNRRREEPQAERPPAHCTDCGDLYSPYDHDTDCSNAKWNDRCTCDGGDVDPYSHDTDCRYRVEQIDCMVCSPPDNPQFVLQQNGVDGAPYCRNHDADDFRAKLDGEQQERSGWTCNGCGLRREGQSPEQCPNCRGDDFKES